MVWNYHFNFNAFKSESSSWTYDTLDSNLEFKNDFTKDLKECFWLYVQKESLPQNMTTSPSKLN